MRFRGCSAATVTLLACLSVCLSACQSIGPATVMRDQFDYNKAIANSQKQQLMLNMVRLRYGDAPIMLNVTSVIAQYSLDAQVTATTPGYDRPNNVGPPIASAAARWTDRPTITYQPVTGGQLAKTLLTPVSIEALFSLIQSGWPVELTLRNTVRSLKGAPSYSGRTGIVWNEAFLAGVEAIARVRDTGAAVTRREGQRVFFVINPHAQLPEQLAAVANLRSTLELDAQADEYELVVSAYRGTPTEITLAMSSVLDVLNMISSQFLVPSDHVSRGWTYASAPQTGGPQTAPIVVRSSTSPPEDAFVATYERDTWFWIDDGDYASKRAFSFLAMLLTLAESGGPAGPVVTIGTGG